MTIIVKVRQYYTMQTINVALGCYSGVEGRPVAWLHITDAVIAPRISQKSPTDSAKPLSFTK